MDDNIMLLLNNVQRIKNSHKRFKLCEGLKKNASPTGIVFLQEMYSLEEDKIE